MSPSIHKQTETAPLLTPPPAQEPFLAASLALRCSHPQEIRLSELLMLQLHLSCVPCKWASGLVVRTPVVDGAACTARLTPARTLESPPYAPLATSHPSSPLVFAHTPASTQKSVRWR